MRHCRQPKCQDTAMRSAALAEATAALDNGSFLSDLARRVAIPSESQNHAQAAELHRYLDAEMIPSLERLGFTCEKFDNPKPGSGPILYAERIEDPALPTCLTYGHGDVALGIAAQWRDGLNPWTITTEDDRLYGRGTADNKGQHSINLAALDAVLKTRGHLGFNVKIIIEMAEETGSPGLRDFCIAQRERLKADVFIASDGPRLSPNRPTIFLGARGAMNFDLTVDLRQGAFHSGNWGGLLANPAIILAHALATITSPQGAVRVREWVPDHMPNSVRVALADCPIEPGPDAPAIDPEWGEPGLTAAEKVFGWSSFEILALDAGNPSSPVNAIPPRAKAACQIRYVVGPDRTDFLPALRRHLDQHGFPMVAVTPWNRAFFAASRLDPEDPWVRWATTSVVDSVGIRPSILPNMGGSGPIDVFSDVLGLSTLWVPHSYAGCAQHGADEHMLLSCTRQALAVMAGLFWDLGDTSRPAP
jgi:acetylornithine deacetylase/succinyl-diaminopimelate desuccinylase-like protein